MKKLNKNKSFFILVAIFFSLALVVSCSSDDTNNTDNPVELLSFGPSGLKHGETIAFIGNNLNRVTSIKLEGAEVLKADFVSQSDTKIELVIPAETLEGKITLVYDGGEIISKTVLSFDVPFMVAGIPTDAKPGSDFVITGEYLNWVSSVIFADGVEVEAADFVSVTANKLVVKVPFDAQTGPIELIGGGTEPYTYESEQTVLITLPAVTSIDPTSVKHGDMITLTGTDLDLVASVKFPGSDPASGFESQTATKIVMKVPNMATDGKITVNSYSGIAVQTQQSVKIILPVIATVGPAGVAIGADWTITGTDLDLIKEVIIPGAATPVTVFVNQSPIKLVLKVPAGSFGGIIKLKTINDFVILTTTKIDVAGSGPIPLGRVIFDDSLKNSFENWGWGVQTDVNYTQNIYEGTTAIRKDWTKPDGSGGGIQFGNGNISTTGMSELVLVIYGGVGLLDSGKHKIVINGKWDDGIYITVPVGKWTELTIPISSLPLNGDTVIKELVVEGKGTYSLLDKIGLR